MLDEELCFPAEGGFNSMASQENEAGPPTLGNAVGPGAGPIIANVAPPAGAPPAEAHPAAAPPGGPDIANVVAPLVAPVVAALARPIVIVNLAGIQAPPAGEFDVQVGLLGSPPRKSNIGCEIHAWIDEEWP
jgi:hypothetical protein